MGRWWDRRQVEIERKRRGNRREREMHRQRRGRDRENKDRGEERWGDGGRRDRRGVDREERRGGKREHWMEAARSRQGHGEGSESSSCRFCGSFALWASLLLALCFHLPCISLGLPCLVEPASQPSNLASCGRFRRNTAVMGPFISLILRWRIFGFNPLYESFWFVFLGKSYLFSTLC